jgi:gas vesicle protein
MKEELNVKDERSILVPFLVGGFVGAGIALLLAPKSGKELRKDIEGFAADTRGRIVTTVEKGKGLIEDIAADTRDKIVTTVEKGKELYVEGTEAVKHAIEAGKSAYVSEMEKHRKVA